MKVVLPKEHGSWMMFFLPVTLGILFSSFHLSQLFFIIGWFFLFLASTPFFNLIRNKHKVHAMFPWLLGYSVISAVFLIPLIYVHLTLLYIGLTLIPFILVNMIFIKMKNERNLLNDLSGIIIFCIGGLAVYFLGGETLFSNSTYHVILIPVFYFFGSALYVKSLIRERKNILFRNLSHVYHGLLIIIPLAFGLFTISIVYLPSLLIDWFTPREKVKKPLYAGIIEIINGLLFIGLCTLF